MKLIQTNIPDVVIIEPTVYSDERGWFTESFNEQRFHSELETLGLEIPRPFVQDNHSCSSKGVLRGLHFQTAPHAQGKLVRVIAGSVYDVVVDIRKNSPTYGQHVSIELSADNKKMLWVPEGFAHGFVALEDATEFLYKTTDYYAKDCEGAVVWNDPALNIQWPSIAGLSELLVNEKDRDADLLKDIAGTIQ